MVQLLSVALPKLSRPAPLTAEPRVMVRPERVAVTPLFTWNTPLWPPPLIVTPAAGPVIVCVPPVSLRSSTLPPRVIV